MRYSASLILGEFRGADIHAAVELHGIDVDNFPVEGLCECDAKRRLASGGWADDSDGVRHALISHSPT
ncbi:Uncharacterised protein [Chlamydia trachomatis]|nr:Uncharacterised protein [Chlamydia trachomatis]